MRTRLALVSSLIVLVAASPTFAQLPATRLASAFPAGATAGSSVTVTVNGANLDGVDRLIFSHAGITAKQEMAEPGPFDSEPQPIENRFVVTVAGNVPVGAYEVRAIGKYGASNPRLFRVGDVPEVIESDENNSVETAMEVPFPVVVNGQSNQVGDVDYFRFSASAKQRVIITTLARRIDSPMDTIVTVTDSQGRQLGSSGDDQGFDSLVDFTTPSTGEYVVKVHDSAYRGGPDFVYRLTIGVLPHIDYVFPPAGQAGGNRNFTIYGRNLPGGQPAGFSIDGRPIEKKGVSIPIPGGAGSQELATSVWLEPASAMLDATEYRLKGTHGTSEPILVGIATAPVVNEVPENHTPSNAQKLTLPCEVMGQFYPARDRDWYEFEAKEGESITLEVISQRLGLYTNPRLYVEQVIEPIEGEEPKPPRQIAYVVETDYPNNQPQPGGPEFDIRHGDPVYQFTVPEDGTYRVMVSDAHTDVRADPRRVYRLIVSSDRPDFRLAAVAEGSYGSVLLRKGGQVGIRVVAFRRDGFDGEIHVTATGLPKGVTCRDAIIGPASEVGMLVLTAAAGAVPTTEPIQVIGKAKLGKSDVTRTARFGMALQPIANRQNANQNLTSVDARLTKDLTLSITDEPALVTLQGDTKVWEHSRGAKLSIPYTRGGTFKGQMNFIPRGLPPNVRAPVGNIPANKNEGEFQIDLLANTPPGTYTFFLDAIAQQVDYTHNPEAAAAALERQKEVNQIKAKADADAKAATDAKTAADKLATETIAAQKKATDELAVAEEVLSKIRAEVDAKAKQFEQAQAQAKDNPDDATLKTNLENAQKGVDEAQGQLKDATAKVETAMKTVEEATVRAKEAADAKVEADANAEEATRLAQLAAELKTRTDQRATALTNAAKPKKVNVPIVSTPITIKIAPAPITMAEFKPAGPLTQGEKLEVPVSITRLYSFNEQVTVNVIIPSGVSGLSIPNGTIPAGKTTASLVITANPNATIGEHELIVRTAMSLNGQNLTVEQPLRLTIREAPKAESE